MGDHRASIKIEAEFHGVKRNADMWINYSGGSGEVEGVDDRIIAFFRDLYETGMRAYEERLSDLREREYAAEIEAAERKELAKLKAKYEP